MGVNMAFLLRFVQGYRPANRDKFMELEAKFAAMEQSRPEYPEGRRLQPHTGRLATNTIVCEFQFDTLEQAQKGLAMIESDEQHGKLLAEQLPYMEDSYTEIYEVLEF
jgi:hypothetical protein